jgi:Lon protease-like protein
LIKNFLDSVVDTLRSRNADTSTSLPLFPLGSVLFPDGTLSLKVFEPRYMDMAKISLKNSTPFGIVLIKEGQEVGTPATPESVGTVARITEWDMQNLGVLQLRVRGESRFKLLSQTVTESGLIVGDVSMLPEDPNVECPEMPPCAGFLRKILSQIGSTHVAGEERFHDATWVSFRITELLPLGNPIKQKMLELTDAKIRLEILHRFLLERQLIV